MDLLSSLRDARLRRLPWREIASDLRALEQKSPLDPSGRPWIQSVEGVSGYTSNHLRRMTKALAAIRAIGDAIPDHRSRLDGLSFSHAEVLARLWQADPAAVRNLLSAQDWPTYPTLLALYEERRARGPAPSAAGKLATVAFRDQARELLAPRLQGELVAPYVHYTYAKPDFLHLTTAPAVVVHGAYDCLVVSERAAVEPIHRRMVSLATECSFFDVYWLIISHRDGLRPIVDGILTLGLRNIGVMLADGGALHVMHGPEGQPLPDRRALYGEFMAVNGARILAQWRRGTSSAGSPVGHRAVHSRPWNN